MALQVWLPLTGNLKNLGLSKTSQINTTNLSFLDNGKIGKCLTGYTGYFNIPSMAGKKQFSVAYWIKINTATSTNWLDAFRWYSTDGTETYGSRNEFYTNCTLTGFWFAGSPNSISGKTTTVGEWHHHVFVIDYSTGIAKFYINGVSVGSVTNVYTTHYLTGENFMIGEKGLDASINDLRIYDDCLSPKEIKELSKGLVAHYPLNDGVGNPNLILSDQSRWYLFNTNHTLERTNDGVKMTVTSSVPNGFMIPFASDNTLVGGETFTLTFKYKTNISNFNSIYLMCRSGGNKVIYPPSTNYYSLNEWKTFSFTSSFPSTSGQVTYAILIPYIREVNSWIEIKNNTLKLEKGSVATPWIPNSADALYSKMGLDNGIVYDCSGYGHNGVTSPNPPVANSDSIRYFTNLQFNGSNNYIDCGVDTWLPTDQITVSLWGYMTTWGSSRLLSCTEGGGWNFEAGDGGGWRFPVYKKGLGYCFSTPTKKWADYTSGWHHIVGTFDGYVSKIYIDGELDSVSTNQSPTVKKEIGYNQSAKFFIGCEAATANPSSPYFSGKISDVRIYATALSAEDVKSLYETRASIDNYSNTYAYEFMEV